MDFSLESVPGWAYNWCYYFAAITILAVIAGLGSLAVSKSIGFANVVFILIGLGIQAATGLTLFWMCRSSLRASAGAEKPKVEYAAQFSH